MLESLLIKEKTHKAKVQFGKLDNFDLGVIRRIFHSLYRENISPSLKKILLQREFSSQQDTFMAIVKENGVWPRKTWETEDNFRKARG